MSASERNISDGNLFNFDPPMVPVEHVERGFGYESIAEPKLRLFMEELEANVVDQIGTWPLPVEDAQIVLGEHTRFYFYEIGGKKYQTKRVFDRMRVMRLTSLLKDPEADRGMYYVDKMGFRIAGALTWALQTKYPSITTPYNSQRIAWDREVTPFIQTAIGKHELGALLHDHHVLPFTASASRNTWQPL